MNITIDYMTEDNLHDVWMVESSSFSHPWSEQSFKDELKNKAAKYLVAYSDMQVTGYVGMWEICGQCDITNIAVMPEFRRMGIGRKLLLSLIEYCQINSLSPITLEVRKTNTPAINLYRGMGFKDIGFRKKYYQDTGEDAIIMSYDVLNKTEGK